MVPFEPESFDFVACVSSLHHLDEEPGLVRMAELLRPGGVLGVVGLARSRLPLDLPWEVAGAVSTRVHKLVKTYWETPAPKIWAAPHSYTELREISQRTLAGSTFRRRALWRYVPVWTKPKG
jgi:SAM-dependent methyltransferase